jgi:hypothetical protein
MAWSVAIGIALLGQGRGFALDVMESPGSASTVERSRWIAMPVLFGGTYIGGKEESVCIGRPRGAIEVPAFVAKIRRTWVRHGVVGDSIVRVITIVDGQIGGKTGAIHDRLTGSIEPGDSVLVRGAYSASWCGELLGHFFRLQADGGMSVGPQSEGHFKELGWIRGSGKMVSSTQLLAFADSVIARRAPEKLAASAAWVVLGRVRRVSNIPGVAWRANGAEVKFDRLRAYKGIGVPDSFAVVSDTSGGFGFPAATFREGDTVVVAVKRGQDGTLHVHGNAAGATSVTWSYAWALGRTLESLGAAMDTLVAGRALAPMREHR